MEEFLANRIEDLVACAYPKISVTGFANTPITLTRGQATLTVNPGATGVTIVSVPQRGEWVLSTTYSSITHTKTIDCLNAGTTYSVNLTT